MKLLTSFLISTLFFASPTWFTDISVAKQEAVKTNKLILVNFSGSDWCAPCIRLKKEILEGDAFSTFASTNLVLVKADFPRMSKNKPSKDQVKKNEALADQYNKDGKFPYTILLDENGKVLKSWDGLPKENSAEFVEEIKPFVHAVN